MKFLCVFIAVFVAVAADSECKGVYQHPVLCRGSTFGTFGTKVGANGRVFGTLGSNDNGLFGKGGYQHQVFNDHRGKLDAQAFGTRVLGPSGDSSHLGGTLNWQNSNAAASLEASKQIHGPASINAAAGGKWPIGKGDISAQGFYSQTQGMGRDYGAQVDLKYPLK